MKTYWMKTARLALLVLTLGTLPALACDPHANCERELKYPCPTFGNPGRMCTQKTTDPACVVERQACHVVPGLPTVPSPLDPVFTPANNLPAPRVPINHLCQTDCFKVFQFCALGTCLVNPAWASLYEQCNTARAIACAQEAMHEPFYGNWCGKGNRGGANGALPPIDDLDAACQRHDKCYESLGDHTCACDARLSGEALAIWRNPRYSANTRQVALDVSKLFGTATTTPGLCIPR